MNIKNFGRKAYIIWAAIALIAIAAPESVMAQDRAEIEATTLVKPGQKAPDFTVELLNGEKITLSSLQEKALMLIFFSAGCPDCQAQFSEMQRLISQSEPHFRIIAISRAESRETTAAFIQEYDLNIDVGIDPNRSIYDKYATRFVPRNYLIDSFGEIKALTVEYHPDEFHSIWQQAEDLAR
jgi:peroxiredoxin